MFEPSLKSITSLQFVRRFSICGAIHQQLGPNNTISPIFWNRNPRNLERLRISPKLQGFPMDSKPSNFWNRLVICQTNKHVSAHIEHFEGRKVVSASTSEWAIKQHLRSNVDVVAMAAIGRILAHRCLECGLVEIHSEYDKQTSSSKISALLKSIEDCGIALSEPERYLPHRHWSREKKEHPAHVFEDPPN